MGWAICQDGQRPYTFLLADSAQWCFPSSEYNNGFCGKIENYVQNFIYSNYNECLDKPICKEKLQKAVKKLRNRKACGYDLVTNGMLESAVYTIELTLLKPFNMCIENGIYPVNWCHVCIIVNTSL